MPDGQQTRIFSFAEATALLSEVRALTRDAEAAVGTLRARAEAGEDAAELEAQANQIIREWTDALHERGIEVKGLWLVDFDNGSGYYCWRWPETKLEYYHSYEEGFGGRMRIH